jgi:transaldolase / glucose-6-phosphate isomerase
MIVRGPLPDVPASSLGSHAATVEEGLARATAEAWAERLFDGDTTLWSTDPRVQKAIADRLGWLDAPDHFSNDVAALEGFGEGIRDAGFRTVVVMGMGGSSLAPEVLHRTFGTAEGWLDLRILDSTDPAAVSAVLDDLDPLSTLFIVASKSGTTTEPLAFQAAAWGRIEAALEAQDADQSPGTMMIAITDPGKSVESIPHHDDLREVFLNPADVGGRSSALTYVGLVPASLIGLDLDALLSSAVSMLGRCREPDAARNPGVSLGVVLGALALEGRNKLTFLADPELASLGSWVEQLIAESTGKNRGGIVPVDLEPIARPEAYGSDRVFVRIALAPNGSTGAANAPGNGPGNGVGAQLDALLEQLAIAGHPVIRIDVPDLVDIAAEFVRWEVATAIAGAVLGIDPFDQPNVEEAKELTRKALARHSAHMTGAAERSEGLGGWAGTSEIDVPEPESAPILAAAGGISLVGDAPLRLSYAEGTVEDELRRHLARLKPNGYVAIQAFIAPDPSRDDALARLRVLLRDATGRATTAGYGPRYLHSTGQLHKGGPRTGWFLQLTADHPDDREIPGWPYTFGRLIDAQAEGDFEAIESHDLPILRVHLGPDPDAGLAALERALAAALNPTEA